MSVELDVFIGPDEERYFDKETTLSLIKALLNKQLVLPKSAVIIGNVEHNKPMGDINIIRQHFTLGLEFMNNYRKRAYKNKGKPLPKDLDDLFSNRNNDRSVVYASETSEDLIAKLSEVDTKENFAVCFQGLNNEHPIIEELLSTSYGNPELVIYHLGEARNTEFQGRLYEGGDEPHSKSWNSFIAFQGSGIITPEALLESELNGILSVVYGELHSGINYS